jgi:hypothetical protein
MRILAIGHIHGCSKAFDSLIAVVDLQPEDRLVTLGGYVDREPDSKGVINRLISGRVWQANQNADVRTAWIDEFTPQ